MTRLINRTVAIDIIEETAILKTQVLQLVTDMSKWWMNLSQAFILGQEIVKNLIRQVVKTCHVSPLTRQAIF